MSAALQAADSGGTDGNLFMSLLGMVLQWEDRWGPGEGVQWGVFGSPPIPQQEGTVAITVVQLDS